MSRSMKWLMSVAVAVAAMSSHAADRGLSVTEKVSPPPATWGTYHALVIGINDYQQWPQLKTAVKDATVLSQVLVERYGFSRDKVTLRTEANATRRQIIGDIRALAGAMKPEDNLLIYFAGHGQLDDLTGDGYWVPVEGAPKDPSTWIANSFVKAVLSSDKVQAKNVVVIADSCYSGAMLRGGPSLLTLDGDYAAKLAKAAARRSRQIISSGGVEPVADGGADGHSLFAYYLIRALNENQREVMDLENLFHTQVWKPVTEIGNQRPNVGRLKTPMDDDGQFVLYNRGWVEAQQRRAEAERRQREDEAARQRAEKADRDAALQAERQRLELERQKLEMEKQLLAQRQQLEMEKLQLEKQKQALEMEKMAAQVAAMKQKTDTAAPPPLAAVSPTVQKPAAPAGINMDKITAALLPMHIVLQASHAMTIENRWREAIAGGLKQALVRNQQIQLVGMDKPWDALISMNVPVYGREIASAAKDRIWEKSSFFALQPDPVVDEAAAIGKRLGVDVVFLVRSVLSRPSGTGDMYLVDTRTKKMYTHGGDLQGGVLIRDAAVLFSRTIADYLSAR